MSEKGSVAFVVPTVAATIDAVVHLASGRADHWQVREIVGQPGSVEREAIEMSASSPCA
jgi:pilus assembly protein CpaF